MAGDRTGVYPGTFDPPTNGHMDVIHRATRVVDRLIVGIAVNAGKGPLFSLEERVAMTEEEIAHLKTGNSTKIEVRPFDNLLTDFVAEAGATLIVRGLRAVSDFEYEFQMASMNAHLKPEIETVFLMASDRNQFIASHLVKEIGSMGGDVAPFVSPRIAARLVKKFAEGT